MIKKYKQFNEGINHLLVGPTKQEIWKSVGGDFYFDTPPPTKEEFLDKIFEQSEKIVTTHNVIYNYKNTTFVCYHIKPFPLSISHKITYIMGTFYEMKKLKELKWFYEDYFNNKFKELGDKDKYKMNIEISDGNIFDVYRRNKLI